MAKLQIRVKRLSHCKSLPHYATSASAGMDLTAAIDAPLTLHPWKRFAMPTGIILEIPPEFEGQVRPRSGLAINHGITLVNCVGTIDADFREELKVLLINLGEAEYVFEPGERIAQLLVVPILKLEIEEVDSLSLGLNERKGGFGSTGR